LLLFELAKNDDIAKLTIILFYFTDFSSEHWVIYSTVKNGFSQNEEVSYFQKMSISNQAINGGKDSM
jgi:hypothetical protein